MKHNNQQSDNVIFGVLFVLILIVIAVLIYILMGGKLPQRSVGKTTAVQSPELIQSDNNTISATNPDGSFNDGLHNPTSTTKRTLDEFGAGIASIEHFTYDINNDGNADRITKTLNETGTDHFYYEYKIELNENGKYVDITPDGFRTTEGADCALQKLQFSFTPEFRVVKISRPWQETWTTPTMAEKTTYSLINNKLQLVSTQPQKVICDVVGLF